MDTDPGRVQGLYGEGVSRHMHPQLERNPDFLSHGIQRRPDRPVLVIDRPGKGGVVFKREILWQEIEDKPPVKTPFLPMGQYLNSRFIQRDRDGGLGFDQFLYDDTPAEIHLPPFQGHEVGNPHSARME